MGDVVQHYSIAPPSRYLWHLLMSASLSYRRGMKRDAVLVRYGRTPAQGEDDSLQEVDVDIAPLIMLQAHWLAHGHLCTTESCFGILVI
jgi:hypothetical protein